MEELKIGDWLFGYGRVFKLTEQELKAIKVEFYRRATILDYIRTLSAEKLAKLLDNYFIDHNYKKEGTTLDFLAQPLTEEIVEWLGGKE